MEFSAAAFRAPGDGSDLIAQNVFCRETDNEATASVSGSISVQFAFIAAGLYCGMDVSSSRGGGMKRIIFLTLAAGPGCFAGPAAAAFAAEKRIALVVGEAAYKAPARDHRQ